MSVFQIVLALIGLGAAIYGTYMVAMLVMYG